MEGVLFNLWPLLIVAAVLCLIGAVLKPKATVSTVGELGYRKKKALFTEAERSFLGVLDKCLDSSKYRIFGKVRVADIVEPNPTNNRSEWSRAFGRIKAKHFDYLICAADTLKPVCAIELDDKSHSQKKRLHRDQLLERVCKDANLSLIRVPVKRSYKPEGVKEIFAKQGLTGLGGRGRYVASSAASAIGKNDASQMLGNERQM